MQLLCLVKARYLDFLNLFLHTQGYRHLLRGRQLTSHGPFARERTSALSHYSRGQSREVWKRSTIEVLRFSSV